MSEVAPNLAQDIIDIAWLAADNANFAHTALEQAKAAREQIEATANLGLVGVTIAPETYTTLDKKILRAEQEFDLFGQMAAPVMRMEDSPFGSRHVEALPPLTPTEQTAPESPSPPVEPTEAEIHEPNQPAVDEPPTPSPEPSQSEHSVGAEVGHHMSRDERARKIRQQYTQLLHYVLLRTDKEATYAAEDLSAELRQETGVSPAQLRKATEQLETWKCISAERDIEDNVKSITLHADAIDRAIIKRRIALFPNESTASKLLRSRERELARIEDQAEQTPANNPDSVAHPPTSRVSARVRRQMERDAANQADTAARQDPPELVDEELAGLTRDIENLSPEQYQKIAQEPLKQVVLAFLDETIIAGPIGEKVGAQLEALLPLAPDAVAEAYREMKARNYLERTPAGDVQQPPVLTSGARHFIRNIIQQATARS